jgi:hypothetical protein
MGRPMCINVRCEKGILWHACGVQAPIVAFQAKRSASYSEMSQSASSLGMPMSVQGMEQRLNESSA